jgi:hypothetical protein
MTESKDHEPGLVQLIANDLERLHMAWMGLRYPHHRNPHPVLGKHKPSTAGGKIGYRAWSFLSVPVLAVGYPLAVLGFFVRFHSRRLYRTTVVIGLVGVLALSILAWGSLVLFTYFRGYPFEGTMAVAAGGATAAVSSVLAVLFTRYDGRFTTVALAYPFGVTALFLPPVVAAMYSPALASMILPRSETLAIWLLDNPLRVVGVASIVRANFDLIGFAYVGMWFAIAIPVGWTLGILVSLADVVRPSDRDE